MRSLVWRREALIDRIRCDVWRYLTPAADVETELLDAAALLKMPAREIQTVAQLQFLASEELGALLRQLPFLVRRLATATTSEEEWSAERVRGSIQWSKTLSMRAATGLPHLFVTEPARRAFQTPENELLVFLLDEVVRLGKLSGWYQTSAERIGRLFTQRVQEADRWRHARMLASVERRPITPQRLARIRSGRHRRRYQAALDAWDVHRALVGTMDRAAIRDAVESHGLVTRSDPTLFELVCTFDVIEAIKAAGWKPTPLHLFEGALRLTATREGEDLRLYYQRTLRYSSARLGMAASSAITRSQWVVSSPISSCTVRLWGQINGCWSRSKAGSGRSKSRPVPPSSTCSPTGAHSVGSSRLRRRTALGWRSARS